jgi:transposase
MMGEQTRLQERLFYEFRLDDWVPVDHLLRKIDAVLDLSSLRRELASFCSHTGRPSVDPELLVRMDTGADECFLETRFVLPSAQGSNK